MGDAMGDRVVHRDWPWLAIVPTAGMAVQSWVLLYYKPWSSHEGGSKSLTLGHVTNCVLGSRQLLMYYRVAMAAYMLHFTIPQLLRKGLPLLKFYTTWNWYLLVSYFVIAAWLSVVACSGHTGVGATARKQHIQSASDVQHKKDASAIEPIAPSPASAFEDMPESLEASLEGPLGEAFDVAATKEARTDGSVNNSQYNVGMLGRAMVIMLHINLTTVLLVDVVTWTVLWPMLSQHPDPKMVEFYRGKFFQYESYVQHGANAAFIYIDLMLNTCPLEPYMLGWASLWSVCYAAWAITYYKLQGIWLYPFLNTSRPMAWAAYMGLFLAHWIFFLLGPMMCGHLLRGQGPTVRQAISTVPISQRAAAKSLQRQASKAAVQLQRRTSSLVHAFSAEMPKVTARKGGRAASRAPHRTRVPMVASDSDLHQMAQQAGLGRPGAQHNGFQHGPLDPVAPVGGPSQSKED